MDQGLKSALDKYNGKLGIAAPPDKGGFVNKVTLALAIVTAIVLVFSVCVKYDFLGANKVWSQIENISIGDKTVGSIIDGLGEEITAVFSSNNEETITPVNESGESGSIATEVTS